MVLPKYISAKEVMVMPIIIQGSKAKLIPFLLGNTKWNGNGVFVDVFAGSCSVGFNVRPHRAVFNDLNPHIIRFYNDLKEHKIPINQIKEYLIDKRKRLFENGQNEYYEIRDRFNKNPTTLDFMVLNLTCFRNLCRFNSKGEFNSPFNAYDDSRYILNVNDISNSYLSSYLRRIELITQIIDQNQYEFTNLDFKEFLESFSPMENDFYYFDPPYFLRDTTYFSRFSEEQNEWLINWINDHPNMGFGYSNWYSDADSKNPFIERIKNAKTLLIDHYYYIGAKNKKTSDNKLGVVEAYILSKDNVAESKEFNLSRFIKNSSKKELSKSE